MSVYALHPFLPSFLLFSQVGPPLAVSVRGTLARLFAEVVQRVKAVPMYLQQNKSPHDRILLQSNSARVAGTIDGRCGHYGS